ncbi:MAG: ATP-grasp domain-containing protein, partial [Francisellaceae bacterium]
IGRYFAMKKRKLFCARSLLNNIEFNITTYMIESFVSGAMYHVDTFISQGKIEHEFVVKYTKNPVHLMNCDVGGIVQMVDNPLIRAIKAVNHQVLKSLCPPDGCTHAEYFLTPQNDIYFCEIGARFGGTYIVTTIEAVSGINYAQKWLLNELGLPYEQKNSISPCAGYLDIPAPEMVYITKVSEASSVYPWVIAEEIKTHYGEIFQVRQKINNRIASYAITGNNEKEIENHISILLNAKLITWEALSNA